MLALMTSLFMCLPASHIKAQETAEEPVIITASTENGAPIENKESVVIDVLDLKNIDILDVLKLVSQKSGLNIIAGQNVKGRVTVYLKNVKVLEALRIIVEAYGWAYEQNKDIVKIVTAQEYEAKYGEKFGLNVETRIHQLLYANAADVVAVLNQVKSISGKIVFDEKSNTLIMLDNQKKSDEMEGIIKRIDVPIQTEVFELSYGKAKDLSTTISEILTPNVGKAKFDDRSNGIVVTDTPQKVKQIRQIIEAFDRKDKEVLIEAYRGGIDPVGFGRTPAIRLQ